MATKTDTTRLTIEPRAPQHSRGTRRLRREGKVPGVLYGRGGDPVSFSVDARELRHAMAASGAVFELTLENQTTPAVVKDTQRHPVRGEVMHVDFVRVDLNVAITATVPVTVVGAENAPGVRDGGILSQETNEVTVEALPANVPDAIEFDASGLEATDTVYLDALQLPEGATLVADAPGEVVLVTITTAGPVEVEEPGIEAETEVVGEAPAGGDDGDEGESAPSDEA